MIQRFTSRVLTATTLLSVSACTTAHETTLRLVEKIDYQTTEDSGEPNLFAASDGSLLMSWLQRTSSGHEVKVAVRKQGMWSTPRTAYESDSLFANWADFPSIAATADGTWMVHWLERVPGGTYAYHTRMTRSTDAGHTWSTPITVHRDTSPTEHGFLSMIPDEHGAMDMIWLDGRETGTPDRGPMTIRSTSLRGDGTLGPESLVDGKVCDCCQTALIRAASGLVAAYRDRSDGEIRDIAVRHHHDGKWSEPVHVGDDNWYITGCPVNGPSLSAVGDTVAIAWYTAPERDGKVQVAFSMDGGRSFGPGVRVDDGQPLGRVDIELLSSNQALVTWLERVGEDAEVRMRQVTMDGTMGDSQTLVATTQARQGGFPRIARLNNEVFFAHRAMNGEVGRINVQVAEIVN